MPKRSQRRASWLLLTIFAGLAFVVCTAGLSDAGGKLPCCPDVGDEASFTVCCPTGQSPISELPFSVQATPLPSAETVFEATPQTSPDRLSLRRSFSATPYASADAQALLSTFLI